VTRPTGGGRHQPEALDSLVKGQFTERILERVSGQAMTCSSRGR